MGRSDGRTTSVSGYAASDWLGRRTNRWLIPTLVWCAAAFVGCRAYADFGPAQGGGSSEQFASWSEDASGDIVPDTDNADDIGTSSAGVRTVYADTSVVTPQVSSATDTINIATSGGDFLTIGNSETSLTGVDSVVLGAGLGNLTVEAAAVTATVPVTLATYAMSALPSAATAGQIIYISDGAAGQPVLAFSNGTNWLRVDTLATVSGS